jgi:hypothetical protein
LGSETCRYWDAAREIAMADQELNAALIDADVERDA